MYSLSKENTESFLKIFQIIFSDFYAFNETNQEIFDDGIRIVLDLISNGIYKIVTENNEKDVVSICLYDLPKTVCQPSTNGVTEVKGMWRKFLQFGNVYGTGFYDRNRQPEEDCIDRLATAFENFELLENYDLTDEQLKTFIKNNFLNNKITEHEITLGNARTKKLQATRYLSLLLLKTHFTKDEISTADSTKPIIANSTTTNDYISKLKEFIAEMGKKIDILSQNHTIKNFTLEEIILEYKSQKNKDSDNNNPCTTKDKLYIQSLLDTYTNDAHQNFQDFLATWKLHHYLATIKDTIEKILASTDQERIDILFDKSRTIVLNIIQSSYQDILKTCKNETILSLTKLFRLVLIAFYLNMLFCDISNRLPSIKEMLKSTQQDVLNPTQQTVLIEQIFPIYYSSCSDPVITENDANNSMALLSSYALYFQFKTQYESYFTQNVGIEMGKEQREKLSELQDKMDHQLKEISKIFGGKKASMPRTKTLDKLYDHDILTKYYYYVISEIPKNGLNWQSLQKQFPNMSIYIFINDTNIYFYNDEKLTQICTNSKTISTIKSQAEIDITESKGKLLTQFQLNTIKGLTNHNPLLPPSSPSCKTLLNGHGHLKIIPHTPNQQSSSTQPTQTPEASSPKTRDRSDSDGVDKKPASPSSPLIPPISNNTEQTRKRSHSFVGTLWEALLPKKDQPKNNCASIPEEPSSASLN